MGLSGGGSTKTKSTTNQSSTDHAVNTPTNPPWVTGAIQDFLSKIGSIGQVNPYDFVAGPSPLSMAAYSAAQSLGGGAGYGGGGGGGGFERPSFSWPDTPVQAGTQTGTTSGTTPRTFSVQGSGFLGNIFKGAVERANQRALAQAPAASPAQAPYTPPAPAQLGYNDPYAFLGGEGGGGGSGSPQMGWRDISGMGVNTVANLNLDPNQAEGAAPVNADTIASGIKTYMDPYLNDVVNTSLADFDQQAGATRAAQAADAARNGAFGGSRYGIREAQTEGELARGRASLEAGLRSQGFNTAAGLSAQDVANRLNAGQFNAQLGQQNNQFNAGQIDAARARQLQAASLLGQLGSDFGQQERADIGLLSDLGQQQQQTEQAFRTAPLSQLEALAALYGAAPLDLFNGKIIDANSQGTSHTNSKTSGGGGGFFNTALGIASLFA